MPHSVGVVTVRFVHFGSKHDQGLLDSDPVAASVVFVAMTTL